MDGDTPRLHFSFEHRRRGGERAVTAVAGVACVLVLAGACWAFVDGWTLRQSIGEGGTAQFLITGALLWPGLALLRYVVRQLRAGCAFTEMIEIDDNAVLYRYLNARGETRWSEALEYYVGVQIVVGPPRRGPLGWMRSRGFSFPRSPFSTGATPFTSSLLLVHGAGKTICLRQEGGTTPTPSAALEKEAADMAARLRLEQLPMRTWAARLRSPSKKKALT